MQHVKKVVWAITIIAAWSASTTPAHAANPAAVAFGAREYVRQISLSPDGTHVAIIMPTTGHGSVLEIADLVTGGAPKPILQTTGYPDRLTDCHWSTDKRIVCQILVTDKNAVLGMVDYTRIIALDSDGTDKSF